MGSSFEDLVETSPLVKTDCKLDKRFELSNFLNFKILHLMQMITAIIFFYIHTKHFHVYFIVVGNLHITGRVTYTPPRSLILEGYPARCSGNLLRNSIVNVKV
jgi:hypothetical protein